MSSLANRYLHALLSQSRGPRPRAGYSFWQRYWASLTGIALTPRPAQADSPLLHSSPHAGQELEAVLSRFPDPVPVRQRRRSNRRNWWGVAIATVAVVAGATGGGLAITTVGSGPILQPGVAVSAAGRTSTAVGISPSATLTQPGVSLSLTPPPGPPIEGVGTVQLPQGYVSIYVHKQPFLRSSVVARVPDGTPVGILCVAQGQVVTNPDTGQSSSLWDNTTDGYIPALFVNTRTSSSTIGYCSS